MKICVSSENYENMKIQMKYLYCLLTYQKSYNNLINYVLIFCIEMIFEFKTQNIFIIILSFTLPNV